MQMGLLEAVRRFTDAQVGGSPFATAIEGLTILRSDHEKRPNHLISKPALCITVQGAKWAIFGDERFDYKAGQALPARYSQGHCSALPAIMRETCYWLLTGPHGGEFVKMTLTNSHAQRVISASHLLRDRFAEPIRIEDLAAVAQMIPSAFHRQFKAITSMRPLQYQKQLRLRKARRLMVSDAFNVETAAFQVGYQSPSQFSREYSRMFTLSPQRDIASLRRTAA